MFSSKIVNDVTESIICPYRQLINVRRFTFVQLVNGKESNCKLIQIFFILKLWQFARLFARLFAMACVNLDFPPAQKLNSNETLQLVLVTRGFNAAYSHWIPSVR